MKPGYPFLIIDRLYRRIRKANRLHAGGLVSGLRNWTGYFGIKQKMAVKIRIEETEHQGQKRLALYFRYDEETIALVRRIEGMKWSNSKKCWHGPMNADLSSLAYLRIDLIETKTKHPKIKIDQQTPNAPISVIEKAMHKMETYMVYRRYSKVSIKSYLSSVRTFLYRTGVDDLSKISVDNLQEYIREQRKKNQASASWQNILISAIKLFYQSNEMRLFRIEKVQRPKKGRRLPETLSEVEVLNLLRSTKNKKHYCLLSLIYSGGLRIGETLNLRIEHISMDDHIIYIKSGKGDRDRCVPLSKKIKTIIQRYLEAYKPKRFLFEGQIIGKKYSAGSAQKVLKRSVALAGIKKNVTLHTLRHSYATHLLERGIGLRYIQEILGHKSPKTTMIYTHVSGKKLREIKSPLDDMDI